MSALFRLFFAASLCALALLPRVGLGFVVSDIRIEGLQRISAGTIFNYLPVKVGDEVSKDNSAKIIRALYATGFFKDVRLEQEGDVLVVFVHERPAIAKVDITGNKDLDTDILKDALKDIGLAEGRVFKRAILEQVEQELNRQYYARGKYGIKIQSTVSPLERNRVAVEITISEGLTARIKRINIIGNKAFDEDDLLDEFELGIPAWYMFFSSKDKYSKQALSGDLEKLRSYYYDRGYVDFKIESTQVSLSPDKKDIYITIAITEGEVYTLSDIKLAGELELPQADLFPLIHLKRGEVFSRKEITASAERITGHYSDAGYAFANINSIPDIDREKRQVAITYFVDPGKRAYVRRINVSGNATTNEEVIRRELRQMESAWFSGEQVKLSRERLQRLGYFGEVNVETPAVTGRTDQVDVDVKVEEISSGTLSAGVGYSQTAGATLSGSISENNFLGTGKQVSAAFDTSKANQQLVLKYTNPYYTIDGVSRGFEASYHKTDYAELNISNYSTDISRLGMNLGLPVTEYDRLYFSLALENTELFLGSSPSSVITDFVDRNGDSFVDYEFITSWTRDTRNTAIFPSAGGKQYMSLETNLPSSDLLYWRLSYRNSRYLALTQESTLGFNLDLGYGEGYSDGELPFFRNFFAGGIGTVRGFKGNSLGPKDEFGNSLGANSRITGQMELLFPPPGNSFDSTMRWGLFVDAGNVFDLTNGSKISADEIRASTGVMMSWISPVGPLQFSFAYPFKEQPGDEHELFQFSIGIGF